MLNYTVRRLLAAFLTLSCVWNTPRLGDNFTLNVAAGMSFSALTIWTMVSWTCGWPKLPTQGPADEITEASLLYPDGSHILLTVVVHRQGDIVTAYEPSVELPPRTRLDMSAYRQAKGVSS